MTPGPKLPPGSQGLAQEVRYVPGPAAQQGRVPAEAEPPFTLGVDFAGTVASGPDGFETGDRVAGVLPYGGAAERVACPASFVSLRSLAPQGRLLVVGFAAGPIPEVRVNRLLLNNIDVRGVGWGAFEMVRQGYLREQWRALLPMLETGLIDPPIAATYEFDDLARALADLEDRAVLGKAVVRVRD